MSGKLKDESGNTYYLLTVISLDHLDSKSRAYYKCRCRCGTEKIIRMDAIKSGNTQSCGCLNRKLQKMRATTMNVKHGGSKSRLYRIWVGMRDRCSTTSKSSSKNYSEKGIKVCAEWNDFIAFKTWAEQHGYADNLQIDRIDPESNYEPKNCHWVTPLEQQRNRGNSIKITIEGTTKTLKEWAIIFNVNYHTLYQRFVCGRKPRYNDQVGMEGK